MDLFYLDPNKIVEEEKKKEVIKNITETSPNKKVILPAIDVTPVDPIFGKSLPIISKSVNTPPIANTLPKADDGFRFYETPPANQADVYMNPIKYFINEPLSKEGLPQYRTSNNYVMKKDENVVISDDVKKIAERRPIVKQARKKSASTISKSPILPDASTVIGEKKDETIPDVAVYQGGRTDKDQLQDLLDKKIEIPDTVRNLLPEEAKNTLEVPVTKTLDTTKNIKNASPSDGASISDYYNIIGKALITFGPALIAKLTGEKDMASAWGGGLKGLQANVEYERWLDERNRKLASEKSGQWKEVEPTYDENTKQHYRTIMNTITGEVKVLPQNVYEKRSQEWSEGRPVIDKETGKSYRTLINKITGETKILPEDVGTIEKSQWVEIKPIFDPQTKQSYRALMNKITGEVRSTGEIVSGLTNRNMAPIIKEVQDPITGSVTYEVADPTNLQEVREKIQGKLRGYAPFIGKLPGTEELARIPRQVGSPRAITGAPSGTKTLASGANKYSFSVGAGKQIESIHKDLMEDKIYNKYISTKNDLEKIYALLENNNPAAKGPLQTMMARVVAGEVGALSVDDVRRLGGSQALISRFKQVIRDAVDGKWTVENVKYFKELVSIVHKHIAQQMENIRNQYITARMPSIYRAGGEKALEYVKENIFNEKELSMPIKEKVKEQGANALEKELQRRNLK